MLMGMVLSLRIGTKIRVREKIKIFRNKGLVWQITGAFVLLHECTGRKTPS